VVNPSAAISRIAVSLSLEQDEVQLHVLPRRDVAEPARVLRRDAGDRAQLRRGQDALRDLDPQHLHAVLPLTVCAAQQTEPSPLERCDLAALVLAQHVDELIDVPFVGEIQARAPEHLRVIDDGHNSPLSFA
jgi:hypothetical protein